MAQTTILAAGQTAATSSTVTVGEGESVTIGLFTATGPVPFAIELAVQVVTPGVPKGVARLTAANPTTVLAGPGVFQVRRSNITAYGKNVGVFKDDGT